MDTTGRRSFRRSLSALEKLKVDSAIVDGEVVVLDQEGRSDFQALQAMLKNKEKAEPVFFAFDLPFCNGVDLTQTPLIERKERLEKFAQAEPSGPANSLQRTFRFGGRRRSE